MFSVSNQRETILILSISKKFSTGFENLYQWGKSRTSISSFTLDLLKAQDMATTEDIFYHLERSNRKLSFLLKKDIIYIVGSETVTQSQLLEAVLEETTEKFTDFYKQKLNSYEGGFVSEYREFDMIFQKILDTLNDIVKVVMAPCKACGSTTKVLVKKSIFEKPHKSYPIPLVFCHKGHALLIYLDQQYQVRASEVVDMNVL